MARHERKYSSEHFKEVSQRRITGNGNSWSMLVGVVLVGVVLVSLIVSAATILLFIWSPTGYNKVELDEENVEKELATPERVHYIYEWDDTTDSQGSYTSIVANLYILLKTKNIEFTKQLISKMIPDPDTEWNTIASCMNEFIPQGMTMVPITGVEFTDLPAPSIISFDSSKYVVFLYADYMEVTIANPEKGVETISLSRIIKNYNDSGKKALFITDQGYTIDEHPEYK